MTSKEVIVMQRLEIAQLKTKVENLEEENKRLHNSLEKAEVLLKHSIDNNAETLNELSKQIKQNNNLKQVIEILKSKIEFEDLGEMQSGNMYRGYFNDCLDEEEVKSVKEVFENVKD